MLEIKNKIEFENNLYVAEIDASKANSSQEERIKFVTDMASICKGRLGFTIAIPEKECTMGSELILAEEFGRLNLYNRLLKEASGSPSTPFEFIPVNMNKDRFWTIINRNKISDEIRINLINKYSYFVFNNGENTHILTNMRCLLNAGIKEEDIPFNTPEEVEGFKVVVAKIPKTAFDHLVTHRELGRIAESSRNKKYLNEVEFYYDNKLYNPLRLQLIENDCKELLRQRCYSKDFFYKPEDATKELSCRRLMLCGFHGWIQNPNGWQNLFNLRINPKAQSITRIVVENIKKLINENNIN
jgi:thymidylate synthase (FAD)